MPNIGPPATDERTVLLVHPHWKTIVRPLFLLVLTLAAAVTLLVVIPSGTAAGWERLAVGVAAILVLLVWVLVPILRWRTTTYELTTRRFRMREGIIARRGRDIPLARITDVSFERGPIDRLLGSGTLVVESPGEHGQLRVDEIPGVEAVQTTLYQLVEDEQHRLTGEERA